MADAVTAPKAWTRPKAPWVALGLAIAVLGAALGYIQHDEHQAVAARTRNALEYQASVLNENLARRLEKTSNALDVLRDEWRALRARPDGPALLDQRLKAMVASMTGVRSLAVMDAEGRVIASSRDQLVGLDFRNSERFETVRRGADPETLYISSPFVTPLDVLAISAGKMVADARGNFDGYVLAILDPAYFTLLIRSALFAPGVTAAIIHADGKLFLRVPDPERLTGMNLGEYPTSLFARFAASGEQQLFLEGVSGMTGTAMLAVLGWVQPAPIKVDKRLVVAISVDRSEMYAQWWHETLVRAGAFGCASLLSALGLLVYQRRQRSFMTQKVAHEAERQVVREKLLESTLSLQLAVEAGRLGVWEWRIDEQRMIWSDLCLSYFGFAPCVEMTLEKWAAVLHPADLERVEAAVARSLATVSDYDEEYRVVWPQDGTVHWLHVVGRPQRSAEGVVTRMEGVVQDISARKEAEARLLERNHQVELLNVQLEKRAMDAEAAARAKEAFIRAISHELRTPLNHITSGAEILLRGPLDEKQGRWLQRIRSASQDLLRMVNEVIDIAYMADGTLKLEAVDFDLPAVLNEARLMLASRAEARGLKLDVDVQAGLPARLNGDPVRIAQALYNLLDNAIKFTPAGSITLSAHLVSQGGNRVVVCFEVRDTGIGIDEDALSSLLRDDHLFNQLDSAVNRKYGGLGLGLSNVRELARRMGGTVGAKSMPGAGSTFWFTARLALPQAAA